ncbi:threonine synthase [Jeotgalibacillus marinus]|uniref:Threonine synthase n=1 Tax=Jeotgalibacillus marinus TaxID=86667 RepID=A0ABV3Q349_9BACL
MDIYFVCADCGETYDPRTLLWRCSCGGLLNVGEYTVSFPIHEIKKRAATMWRYTEALPFSSSIYEQLTMGEGYTPMIPLDSDSPHILLKMDYMMPTLSFKDRGAAVLIAKAKELGVTHVIADSSGNAGTSIAAYASRAGITCDIYVPASTSPKKLKQIKAHGATLHEIPGSREDTAAAAIEEVEKRQVFYASHVYNPFFYQGTKTYAFEVWEQLNGDVPDAIVIPVGNGTLLLGAYYGFRELLQCGMISKIPRFIAIQAEGCAPLAQAFDAGKKQAEPVINSGTSAEGIAIAFPARHRQILEAIRDTDGTIITAPEQKIEQVREELANKGLYVEPTTAATYAGYLKYLSHRTDSVQMMNEKIVISLCGAGIKAN